MRRLTKTALLLIPTILAVALITFRATQDPNIIKAINYSIYSVVFTITTISIITILGLCIISFYKAILTLFGLKKLSVEDTSDNKRK